MTALLPHRHYRGAELSPDPSSPPPVPPYSTSDHSTGWGFHKKTLRQDPSSMPVPTYAPSSAEGVGTGNSNGNRGALLCLTPSTSKKHSRLSWKRTSQHGPRPKPGPGSATARSTITSTRSADPHRSSSPRHSSTSERGTAPTATSAGRWSSPSDRYADWIRGAFRSAPRHRSIGGGRHDRRLQVAFAACGLSQNLAKRVSQLSTEREGRSHISCSSTVQSGGRRSSIPDTHFFRDPVRRATLAWRDCSVPSRDLRAANSWAAGQPSAAQVFHPGRSGDDCVFLPKLSRGFAPRLFPCHRRPHRRRRTSSPPPSRCSRRWCGPQWQGQGQ